MTKPGSGSSKSTKPRRVFFSNGRQFLAAINGMPNLRAESRLNICSAPTRIYFVISELVENTRPIRDSAEQAGKARVLQERGLFSVGVQQIEKEWLAGSGIFRFSICYFF
jgi:hypothetical protein